MQLAELLNVPEELTGQLRLSCNGVGLEAFANGAGKSRPNWRLPASNYI